MKSKKRGADLIDGGQLLDDLVVGGLNRRGQIVHRRRDLLVLVMVGLGAHEQLEVLQQKAWRSFRLSIDVRPPHLYPPPTAILFSVGGVMYA